MSKAKKAPAFQFYAAEFLVDENVVLMSNQQVGCYIKLMAYCWREGSIPADVSKVAKLCGEDGSVMAQLWLGISECFEVASALPNRLVHPRLQIERDKQEQFKSERAVSGKKGAQARWDKEKQGKSAADPVNSSAIDKPLTENTSASSSSSSLTTKPLSTPPPTATPVDGDDIAKIFDYWRETMKSPGSKLDEKRRGVIRRALKNYSPRDICRAIQGCSLTPHNQGVNERGQKYVGIHVVLKDADQIDRFIANAVSPPVAPEKKTGNGAWWLSDASALAQATAVGVSAALSGESKETWHARIRAAIDNGGKPPVPRAAATTPLDPIPDATEARSVPSDVSRAAAAGMKDLLKSKSFGANV